jgi:hypothetical protein
LLDSGAGRKRMREWAALSNAQPPARAQILAAALGLDRLSALRET